MSYSNLIKKSKHLWTGSIIKVCALIVTQQIALKKEDIFFVDLFLDIDSGFLSRKRHSHYNCSILGNVVSKYRLNSQIVPVNRAYFCRQLACLKFSTPFYALLTWRGVIMNIHITIEAIFMSLLSILGDTKLYKTCLGNIY